MRQWRDIDVAPKINHVIVTFMTCLVITTIVSSSNGTSTYFRVEEWYEYNNQQCFQGDALTDIGDVRIGITAKQVPATAKLDNWYTDSEARLPKMLWQVNWSLSTLTRERGRGRERDSDRERGERFSF